MDKNSVVVYYSWVGNTEIAAKEIERLKGFETLKIEEKKERKFGNILGAAMGAVFGLKSEIKPMNFSLQKYSTVFLGTPVWGGKTTPAVNKFLSKANFKGKNIYLFITKADEKVPHKVIESITKRVEKKGGKVIGNTSLTTKWDSKTNIPITIEEIKSGIEDWIGSIDLK